MGTVRRLAAAAGDVTLGQAAEAYLATLRGAEQASTRRTYGRILRWVVAEFGAGTGPGEVDAERFAAWFTARWADRAPSTWNVSLNAVRSAAAYWQRQGWLAADFSRMLERRKPRPDRARALSRGRGRAAAHPRRTSACASAPCGGCCTRPPPGRPRCSRSTSRTWTCPTGGPGSAAKAARSTSSSGRPARRGSCPACSRAGKPARCSSTERKARVQLPAADLDRAGRARLSYQQADALFSEGLRRRDLAPAQALRADPRCRDRNRDAGAHERDPAIPLSGRWPGTRESGPRR